MHNKQDKEYKCRVCGYDDNAVRWERFDQELIPLYIICPCCGVEAGLQDSWVEGIRKYRNNWINIGSKWFSPKEKPSNWNLEDQLAQIPEEYR